METTGWADLARRIESRIQRRADIQSTGNSVAVHSLNQTSGGAGYVSNEAVIDDVIAGETEISCREASGRRQSVESRGVVPSCALKIRVGLAHGFIIEESEDLIFPDGAADTAAELIEFIVVSGRCARALAEIVREGVQVGLVSGEEKAAVDVVGAALGCDLNLGACETAVFRVITVGDYFYVVD